MEKEDLQSYRRPYMMGNLGEKKKNKGVPSSNIHVLGYDPINMRGGGVMEGDT